MCVCVCVCSWLPVPMVVVIKGYQSLQYLFPFFLKFDSCEGFHFHQPPLKYIQCSPITVCPVKVFLPPKFRLFFNSIEKSVSRESVTDRLAPEMTVSGRSRLHHYILCIHRQKIRRQVAGPRPPTRKK